MTEKELKKLNRYQLLELLVMQTERADGLQAQVEQLQAQLNDRELRFAELGSIAEASVYVSGVMEAAQKAADLYLESAKKRADELLAQADQKAAAMAPDSRQGNQKKAESQKHGNVRKKKTKKK